MSEYTAYDFYLLRSPLLSVESLLQLDAAIVRDTDGTYTEVRKIFSDPLFQEAIYLASKDLHAILQEWLEGKLTDKKRTGKLLRSLHKYYSRMCTRCTPYGLFAGCATGTIGGEVTNIAFGQDKLSRFSRFDMSFSVELGRYLSTLDTIKPQLKFYPNNTIYRSGGKYRFVEYSFKNKRRYYTLSALSVTDYLAKVLDSAAGGAGIEVLANAVCMMDGSITMERAVQFIHKLIQAQFLVSEMMPVVTGRDFFEVITDKINGLQGTQHMVQQLVAANTILQQDHGGLATYLQTEQAVAQVMPRKNMDIIQTDLFFNMAHNGIAAHVIREIVDAAARLFSISRPYKMPDIDDFKARFVARYEEREVPLAEALDADTGVGYGLAVTGNVEHMPLLNSVALPYNQPEKRVLHDEFTSLIYSKLKQYLQTGDLEVNITDEEIDAVAAKNKKEYEDVPGAFIFGSILAASAGDIDRGNYRFASILLNTPYPAKLFARFAYADEKLTARLKECLEAEAMAYPDAILAEIVHLPEDRLGNVLIRPVLRNYEIPYLCNSALPGEQQFPVDDLMISVRDGRIRLRSKKYNKEIIPRLTNAHNSSAGLPVYRFLCNLCYQQVKTGFAWDWKLYSAEPFLPRVTYKKIILSRARWFLPRLLEEPADPVQYFTSIRKERNMPRYVVLQEDDNELLIDLDSPFSLQHVLQRLKKINVVLLEYLSLPGNCFLRDGNGSYVTEMLIPVAKNVVTPVRSRITHRAALLRPEDMPQRSFMPGSEWLYVKIYAANKEMESVLLSVIKPLTDELLGKGAIDRWFFIRYYDPEPHLRVRFNKRGDPAFWLAVLQSLQVALEPMQQDGRVIKMVIDTYEREMERYGPHTMLLSEELFFADSKAVVDFLDMIEGEEGEEVRWKMGVYSIQLLLEDFDYTAPDKKRLLTGLQKGFFKEFNNDRRENETRLARSLNDKYRQDYEGIVALLDTGKGLKEIQPAMECFRERSAAIQPVARQLKELLLGGESYQRTLDSLLASYIHMAMNRLFLARQRMHELVLYHYLEKYFDSLLKRHNKMASGAGKEATV